MVKELIIGSVITAAVVVSTFNVGKNSSPTNTLPEIEVTLPVLPIEQKSPPTTLTFQKKTIQSLVLNEDQVVRLYGQVSSDAFLVADEITKLSSKGKPIYLLINSPGGSVLDGALIVSAIQASSVPVYTVCMQLCASMAAIIHQYGTERYMVDRSVLMFHPAAGGLSGEVGQMQSRLTWITRYVDKMDAFIAHRSGQSLDTFKTLTDNELWIDAEDSMSSKYADKIVVVHEKDRKLIPVIGFKENNKRLNDVRSFQ